MKHTSLFLFKSSLVMGVILTMLNSANAEALARSTETSSSGSGLIFAVPLAMGLTLLTFVCISSFAKMMEKKSQEKN